MNPSDEPSTPASESGSERAATAGPTPGDEWRAIGKALWGFLKARKWDAVPLLAGVAAGIHLNQYDYPNMPEASGRYFAGQAVSMIAAASCFYPQDVHASGARRDNRSDRWLFTYRISGSRTEGAELLVVIDRHGDVESYYWFGDVPSCGNDRQSGKPLPAQGNAGVRWPGGWW